MNTVYSQFQQAIKREKQYITTYYDNMQYPCLYRKVDDYKNTSNHIEIFYNVTTPISQGQLLTRGGKTFITMNKESIENDTYYKSTLKECNTQIIVGDDNGIGHLVPCYSSDLKQPLPNTGQKLSTVDGNIDLITEDYTQITKFLDINDQHIIMNGTWQVINKIVKSGICYFYMQRILNSPVTYTFDVTSEFAMYDVDEEVQLSILPKVDNITDPESTIICTSSDNAIATVDNTGLVTCISAGSVTITVTWVEQNLTKTITLTVEEDAPLIYIVTITGDWDNNEQLLGIDHSFSATVKDSLGNPVTTTNLVYSVNNFSMAEMSSVTTLTDNHDGTGTVIVGDYDDTEYTTETFDLVCTDTLSGFFGSVTLTVVGLV